MLPLPALLLRTSRCLREAVKDHIHGGAVSASDAALAMARRLQHNTVGGSNSAADFDVAVVGAGVVGLAVARAAALAGAEVLVLEAAPSFGTGTSSRSSEVVHGGLYYPPGSAKAELCVEGRRRLYDYCERRGVAFKRLGKLVVATAPGQTAQLEALAATGAANGVGDLQLLTASEARALEPELRCFGALLSPSTGIVDSHGLMQALLDDAAAAGATLALNSRVVAADATSSAAAAGAITLTVEDAAARGTTTRVTARALVNAAGLGAQAVARRTAGLRAASIPPRFLAKGSYFALSGARAPFSRLIYPLPEPGGLGVHLTLDLAGAARFGPDVEWLDGGGGCREGDATAAAAAEATAASQQQQQHGGLNSKSAGADDEDDDGTETIDYAVDARRGAAFYPAVRSYWPSLPDGALAPAYAGVRPKVAGRGAPAGDFVLQGSRRCIGGGAGGAAAAAAAAGEWRAQGHGAAGVVCLYGIESPGLTASLAIAERVVGLLKEDGRLVLRGR